MENKQATFVGTDSRLATGTIILLGKAILDDNGKRTGFVEAFPFLPELGDFSMVSYDLDLADVELNAE